VPADEDCPSDDLLAAHASGRLSPMDAAEIGEHLQACEDCLDVVLAVRSRAQLAARADASPAEPDAVMPRSGSSLDRYQLRRPTLRYEQ
jgi:predicted anti-sigma-YlaC factor YlaD